MLYTIYPNLPKQQIIKVNHERVNPHQLVQSTVMLLVTRDVTLAVSVLTALCRTHCSPSVRHLTWTCTEVTASATRMRTISCSPWRMTKSSSGQASCHQNVSTVRQTQLKVGFFLNVEVIENPDLENPNIVWSLYLSRLQQSPLSPFLLTKIIYLFQKVQYTYFCCLCSCLSFIALILAARLAHFNNKTYHYK